MENLSILTILLIGCGLFFVLFLGALIAKMYRKATPERALIRTGFGGGKVITDGGTFVVPVLHQIGDVNLQTLRLEVQRKNLDALITRDRLRVDVRAEFYVRVAKSVDAIMVAAQTLGARTFRPEELTAQLQGKFVDALRAVAATLTMDELHEKRVEFVMQVQKAVTEDLSRNGLELESVSLTELDQTAKEYFKDTNAFDAEGLAKLTDVTERKREERNRIEQDTRLAIEQKNLSVERESLKVRQMETEARLEQERIIATAKAAQESLVARERALREREGQEAQIIATQAVKEANIQAEKVIAARDIQRSRELDIERQEARIAVAAKSEMLSKADASAANARAAMVRAEEEVKTVQEVAAAERAKQIVVIRAREEAEKEAVRVMVAAEADRKASEDRASALRIQAQAEADRIRIVAESDQKRLEVEAVGLKAINESKNLLSDAIMAFEVRKELVSKLEDILAAAMKPTEKIESIRMLHINGMPGMTSGAGVHSGGGDGGASAQPTALPNQLVQSLLQYRLQVPLIDKMLSELGLSLDQGQLIPNELPKSDRPVPKPSKTS
ncbi:MAG TPA: flotillin domain-containing protein [Opitutaceae bacterium]|nr:flotillin domain-containing protein [Opitutaceae bacterium]